MYDFIIFSALRIFAAIGLSLLFLTPTMAIAGVDNPAQIYGRMYLIGLASGAAFIALLPSIVEPANGSAAFIGYIVFAAVSLPLLLAMPRRIANIESSSDVTGARRERIRGTFPLLAIGLAVLALPYSGVWAFMTSIAGRAGLAAGQVNNLIVICIGGAICGTLISGAMARRFSTLANLLFGALALGFSLLAIISMPDPLILKIGGFGMFLSAYLLTPNCHGSGSRN